MDQPTSHVATLSWIVPIWIASRGTGGFSCDRKRKVLQAGKQAKGFSLLLTSFSKNSMNTAALPNGDVGQVSSLAEIGSLVLLPSGTTGSKKTNKLWLRPLGMGQISVYPIVFQGVLLGCVPEGHQQIVANVAVWWKPLQLISAFGRWRVSASFISNLQHERKTAGIRNLRPWVLYQTVLLVPDG